VLDSHESNCQALDNGLKSQVSNKDELLTIVAKQESLAGEFVLKDKQHRYYGQ
jgi:hypothetical protein